MHIFNIKFILFYIHFYYSFSFLQFTKRDHSKSNLIISNMVTFDYINNIIDRIENEPHDNDDDDDDVRKIEYEKKEYYKKIKGYDERFCLKLYDVTSCNENKHNNTIELNKIRGFFQKKQLLEKLVAIMKYKKDNETLQYLLDFKSNSNSNSNIIEDINQYNNDINNSSIYSHNILSGNLLDDW